MTRKDKDLALTFKSKLAEAGIVPLQFIVFGSRARGDHDQYSDLDIMLVLDQLDAETEEKISYSAWEIGFESDILICPVTFSAQQLQSGPHRALPLLKIIEQEGVPV
jgi:uncharacterized protein